MSALRDEIRAVLREELAAILSEQSGATVQTVRIDTSEDLNAFARDLVDQMSKPKFAVRVKTGDVRFVLERATESKVSSPAIPAQHTVKETAQAPLLNKTLITEADLADVPPGALLVPPNASITPLARDEAHRKGVRIERTDP